MDTQDRRRRRAAGVPSEVRFKRKWELALDELDEALNWGVRHHVVLADPGYGNCREFRDALRAKGLHFLVGVQGNTDVWDPDAQPQAPQRVPHQRGRPRTRYFDANGQRPVLIGQLAAQLPRSAFHRVQWRQGSRGVQSSRFVALRVRTAERHMERAVPREEVWLLVEWPRGEAGPTKYYLSSLPEGTPLKELVRMAKLRWRVERDYQEMKGEVGLDHFEGRSWRGFHHHATLCMVAHGFLALRRALFPLEEAAMDTAPGAAAAAIPADAPHRPLSAMLAPDPRSRASAWAVAHVTG
ncbi:IS701 family transposase [Comamonas sp. JC664]|nr:IS701 family transposase [Comamonas sp. JC664]